VRTAAALVIGNELLSGKITDANVVVLARTLRPLGIRFARVVMILDDVDTIAREVRALASSHDVVFTSGGVGPTHDDLTVASIAQAFDVPMEVAPSMEQMLRDYYGERITEGHLLMARVPKGSRLVTSPGHAVARRGERERLDSPRDPGDFRREDAPRARRAARRSPVRLAFRLHHPRRG
jgi:molybdenum cofactor synthesis domain-containing protein